MPVAARELALNTLYDDAGDPLPPAYSGTRKYTQTRFASSTIPVIRNTQRRPNAAATAPPLSGPSELPRNIAEDAVIP